MLNVYFIYYLANLSFAETIHLYFMKIFLRLVETFCGLFYEMKDALEINPSIWILIHSLSELQPCGAFTRLLKREDLLYVSRYHLVTMVTEGV